MSNTISLQIDNVQRVAIYGILAVLVVLFGAIGALFGVILGALFIALVIAGVTMLACVVLGTSLVKIGLVAVESAAKVYAGKLAMGAARRVKTPPVQESTIPMGAARPRTQRTQRTSTYVPRSYTPSSSYADFVKQLGLHQMAASL